MTLRYDMTGPYAPPADDYEDGEGEGYTIAAFEGATQVGHINVSLIDGSELHVLWMEINEDRQREGLATRLMDHTRQRFQCDNVDTSGLTDEGRYWWSVYWERTKPSYTDLAS